MVTLKDIASQCGLSVATVSKAMNNMPDISPATAQRIQETARKMGYLPNAAARSMKTGRSMTIGMLLFLNGASVWTHNYFSAIAASIHRVMEENGYDLTPVSCGGAAAMGSYLNYCRYRNYDGVIVMSGGYSEPTLMELVNSDLPLVTIDYEFHHRGAVTSDNVQGMHDLVHYIYRMGHRRIAFIHGEETSVTRTRLASFYTACEELNLDVSDGCVKEARFHDLDSSAQATEELLRLPQRPTCILYPDDYSYLGGLRVLNEHGLSIPGDISVAGYDGTYLADVLQPKLCTFRQDCVGIGVNAAEMLLSAISKPRTFIPRHIILPGQLQEGASVRDLNRL